jgi:hypothetical protein
MTERRWGKRFAAEIQARFGEKDLNHLGLVQDISIFGFFIVTAKTFPIGTHLKIQITAKDQKVSDLLGTVQWSKERPQTSVWVARDGGLGIQIKTFIQGQEHYESLCQELCRDCAKEIKNTCPKNTGESARKPFALIRKIFPTKG